MLVFGHGEQRWPLGQIVEVEVDVVVLSQRIEVGEVGSKEVLRTKGAERCHNRLIPLYLSNYGEGTE